jgi:hypothetical protein
MDSSLGQLVQTQMALVQLTYIWLLPKLLSNIPWGGDGLSN